MYALIPASLHDLTGLEPFQSEQWARVKQYLGWKGYAFFITDEKGKELAIFLCLVRQLFPGFSLAYIPLGPLSLQGVRLPECMESDASWLESISRQLHTYIGTAVFQIQWDLPWHTQSADIQSTARIHVCKESTQPTGTWVVDLRSGLEEVRKEYRKRARRHLAKNKGIVEVRPWQGNEQELLKWYDIYCKTARNDGFTHRSYGYIKAVLEECKGGDASSSLDCMLLFAYVDEKMEGGIIVLYSRYKGLYLFGGADRTCGYSVSYSLQDSAIAEAVRRKCSCYDFYGVPSGSGNGSHLSSLLLFKQAFGGNLWERMLTVNYAARPMIYAVASFMESVRFRMHRH